MKLSDRTTLFLIALFFGCVIYTIRSVLTPFIFSLVIAYFLNPLVNICDRKYKMSRLAATSVIMILFTSILVLLGMTVLPLIYNQFVTLLTSLPTYFQILVDSVLPSAIKALNNFGFKINADISLLLQDEGATAQFVDFTKSIVSNALSSSATIINILSLIFLTPILIFYLLKDWNALIGKIDSYLPRSIATVTKKIAHDIDISLSSYVRGQFNVCLILATIYTILLGFSGLNFGFLIGFCTGILVFIPYIGMLCGVTVATIVGLVQWGFDPTRIVIITSIFVGGQIIESNFLTPKLIGDKIGLHPVWVIFGLFVFGSLFGFIGVVCAVPLTAIAGVLIKHFLFEYKKRFAQSDV